MRPYRALSFMLYEKKKEVKCLRSTETELKIILFNIVISFLRGWLPKKKKKNGTETNEAMLTYMPHARTYHAHEVYARSVCVCVCTCVVPTQHIIFSCFWHLYVRKIYMQYSEEPSRRQPFFTLQRNHFKRKVSPEKI